MSVVATGLLLTGILLVSNLLMYVFAYHDSRKKLIRELVNDIYFEHGDTLYGIKKIPIQDLVYLNQIDENTEHA